MSGPRPEVWVQCERCGKVTKMHMTPSPQIVFFRCTHCPEEKRIFPVNVSYGYQLTADEQLLWLANQGELTLWRDRTS